MLPWKRFGYEEVGPHDRQLKLREDLFCHNKPDHCHIDTSGKIKCENRFVNLKAMY